MKTNWLKTTTDLVRESDMSLAEVARGSGLPYRWLIYLMDGKYGDTGINRIQRLYNYMMDKQGANEGSPNGKEVKAQSGSDNDTSTRRNTGSDTDNREVTENFNSHAA